MSSLELDMVSLRLSTLYDLLTLLDDQHMALAMTSPEECVRVMARTIMLERRSNQLTLATKSNPYDN